MAVSFENGVANALSTAVEAVDSIRGGEVLKAYGVHRSPVRRSPSTNYEAAGSLGKAVGSRTLRRRNENSKFSACG